MVETRLLNQRYVLEKTLGTGGMAVVYSAFDNTLARTVAIKVLRQDYSSDASFRARFHEEAKAVANLTHPNIVTIHDFGLDEGNLFIVMEYVPGTDLKTLLERRGRLKPGDAVNLMIQACSGVGYAHRAGIVHCDLKPQNLLVTPDRRLKVADFGIARALASIQPGERAEVVWGSPQYFAPEQAMGDPPSPASDVYSLGVVLYEMLTGQLPFVGTTAGELARLHREVRPNPPRELNPAVPLTLSQIVMKVLSKEPSARYRTADQFGRVLMSSLATTPDTGPTATPVEGTVTETYPISKPSYSFPSARKPAQGQRAQAYTVPEKTHQREENRSTEIDVLTWALGLLALIAVGGLIPFLLWVYYNFNPPIP